MRADKQTVELIVAAVPGFRSDWEGFVREWGPEGDLPLYLAMADLAHYIVEKYTKGTTDEFPALFATVEDLLKNPEPELENLIAVGLFEDIQNVASHREFGWEAFHSWLGPRSRAVWEEMVEGWRKLNEREARQKPRWWQFWRRRRTIDIERALPAIESPELRKIVEGMYRKRR